MLSGSSVPVFIGLGSNLGERRQQIEEAIRRLSEHAPVQARSSYYQSAPLDCPPGSGEFINAVLQTEWRRDDLESLLGILQQIEKELGRPEIRPVNAPRPVDLDVLLAGEGFVDTECLKVPHPRMLERLFVLEPLVEIAPGLVHPATGRRMREHLQELRRSVQDQVCHRIP